MNQLIRSTLTSLILAAASLPGMAHAQSVQWALKAHIPFEFNVGDKTFPAGDYYVRQVMQNYLALRNDRGQTIASVFTREITSLTAPEKPVLRFHSSDGQFALAEIWRPEDSPYAQQLRAAKTRASTAKQRTPDNEGAAASKP